MNRPSLYEFIKHNSFHWYVLFTSKKLLKNLTMEEVLKELKCHNQSLKKKWVEVLIRYHYKDTAIGVCCNTISDRIVFNPLIRKMHFTKLSRLGLYQILEIIGELDICIYDQRYANIGLSSSKTYTYVNGFYRGGSYVDSFERDVNYYYPKDSGFYHKVIL